MRKRLSAIPALAPARAPRLAPLGATPGTPATSGGAAIRVLPGAGAIGDVEGGAVAVQAGGTDNGPMDEA